MADQNLVKGFVSKSDMFVSLNMQHLGLNIQKLY